MHLKKMGYILFLLIIGFLLWPFIKLFWNIFLKARQMRDFMRDPADFFNRQAQQAYGQSYGQHDHEAYRPRRRRKKIDPDVAEYVEYTEEQLSQEELDARANRSVNFSTEQQVVDIKWKDL